MQEDSQDVQKHSQPMTSIMMHSHSDNTFAPKLSIKLQENNFLFWNQQVDGVILSHKLHKIWINSKISSMFKTDNERLINIVLKEYES